MIQYLRDSLQEQIVEVRDITLEPTQTTSCSVRHWIVFLLRSEPIGECENRRRESVLQQTVSIMGH
jgi:hypothetical protein